MPDDGSHYICEKHKTKTYYSPMDKRWSCVECEIEDKKN